MDKGGKQPSAIRGPPQASSSSSRRSSSSIAWRTLCRHRGNIDTATTGCLSRIHKLRRAVTRLARCRPQGGGRACARGASPMTSHLPDRSSRRTFLAASLAAGTAALSAQSYGRVIGANDRIRVGFIGVGGMGGSHIESCLALRDADNLELVAACDCWKSRAEAAAARIGGTAFTDYRRLLDGDVDYVTIATPPRSRRTWTGRHGSARPRKSTGTRTTTSSGGTTPAIPAASAPISSFIASRGS